MFLDDVFDCVKQVRGLRKTVVWLTALSTPFELYHDGQLY